MFEAQQFAHTETLILDGPIDRAFPMFGPVLEKKWATGWEPTIIYSDVPLADQAGTIFTSSHPGEPDTIWYINRFDRQHHEIEYLCITPGKHFVVLTIACEALTAAQTRATVTYRFTALSEAGSATLAQLAHRHPAIVRQWEQAINHWLDSDG